MLAAFTAALILTSAPYEAELSGPVVYANLGGGHIDALKVDPQDPTRVGAVFGSRAFVRIGPSVWEESTSPDSVRRWPTAPSAGIFRLPNSEVLGHTTRLGDGPIIIGAAESGVYESAKRFQDNPTATLLPITAPLAVAFDPSGSGDLIAAGDPTGLFVCSAGTTSVCKRDAPGRFSAVAWFKDGTRLASDAKGGLWRFADGAWERKQLHEPFVDITGVVDGGPRYGLGASGKWWLSEDHGLTWAEAEAPAGRLGSGGMTATRTDDGRLAIVDLDKVTHTLLDAGAIPEKAPIRWASPDLVVVGLADGVIAVERLSLAARRLTYPDKVKRPFHAAYVFDESLQIIAGRHQLEHFSAPPEASWTASRFADAALDSLWWILGVIVVGGVLVVWINVRLKRLAG